EDTGHRVGAADRRADRPADALDRPAGTQAPVRRGAEDLRRTTARRLFRRAAHLRRRVHARRQRHAGALGGPAAPVVAGHRGGRQVMLAYFARRLVFAVFLVFAVSSASLLLARLAPGDYASESLGLGARQETIDRARARLGLDRSIAAQYGDWLVRAAHFDFGRSLQYDRPVAD